MAQSVAYLRIEDEEFTDWEPLSVRNLQVPKIFVMFNLVPMWLLFATKDAERCVLYEIVDSSSLTWQCVHSSLGSGEGALHLCSGTAMSGIWESPLVGLACC